MKGLIDNIKSLMLHRLGMTNENASVCAVLEVTSLKTELGRVGTDMKWVTNTTSELTHIKPLSTQLWE